MKKIVISLAATLSLAISVNAAEYSVDPVHSSVNFKIKHLQVSNVKGNFNSFSGMIDFDPATKKLNNVNGVVEINSVNTNNNKRDDHLRSSDFFDVQKFPTMKFEMTEFLQDGDDKDEGKVRGNLTIKDVTKPVEFEYELGGITKNKDGKSMIGVTLEGKLNRIDFKVGEETMALGNEVKIDIELEATEK